MRSELQRITSATSAVRRLGYFVLFSKTLAENPLPQLLLSKRILGKKAELHILLEEACKNLPITRMTSEAVTGEIRSPDAFKRYINTALELGLVQKISRRLYNTKRGQILAALSGNESNIFKLNEAQSYLFLKIFVEKDYDYLTSLNYSLQKHSMEEHEAFFAKLEEIWQKKLTESSILRNVRLYSELKNAVNTKWDVPDRYFKEIIKWPRLEWLVDSHAVEHWNIKLNAISFVGNVSELLNASDYNFSECYAHFKQSKLKDPLVKWSSLDAEDRKEIMTDLLTSAFGLFKMNEATSKISVNQFLEYSLALLIQRGIICEINELEGFLELFVQSKTVNYRYVKINSDVDRGYISKHC